MDDNSKSNHKRTNIPPGSSPHRTQVGLRRREAAKLLGIGERKLWELTNRGEVPHVRLGRAVVYPVAELERWLSDQCRSNQGERHE